MAWLDVSQVGSIGPNSVRQNSIFRKSSQYPTNYIPFDRAHRAEQLLLRHLMVTYDS